MLLTKDEIQEFQRKYADEIGRHQKIISAMRREGIHILRTQRHGAEDCAVKKNKALGTDAEANSQGLGRAFRAINVGTKPRASDNEISPSERGTSGYIQQASSIPVEMQMDSYNDEEGYANKEALTEGVAKKLSGETHIRTGTSGEEAITSTEVDKIVSDVVSAAMDDWARRYGFDRDLMVRHCSDNNLVGGPKPFHGVPERGNSMVSSDSQIGGHIECLDPPRQPEYSQYSRDLVALATKSLDPKMAHQAALYMAQDRSMKRSDKPSAVFEASGADRIGFAC